MKMIFGTDVDGTILTDRGVPHDETNDAFDYAISKGHYVVIATGRSLSRAKPLLEMMPRVSYLICNNGSLIKDLKNNKIIYLKSIAPISYIEMFNFAKKNNFTLTMHTDKTTYIYPAVRYENSNAITEELNLKFMKFLESNPNAKTLENGEWVTQLSLLGTEELCKKHLGEIQKMFGKTNNVFLTNGTFIDINPLNISKWTSLQYLADHLNIRHENIVTFGDSGNDLEMLQKAGKYGFPLKNSTYDLTKVLEPKIGDNNSNAIAKKIIELVDSN
ncbi:MAG: HAD family hydrolase [Metamycoplasmataceae bacterium]